MFNKIKRHFEAIARRRYLRSLLNSRIDGRTSFVNVGPSIWRYIEDDKCIHFWCDVSKQRIFLKRTPLGGWTHRIEAPFHPDQIEEGAPASAEELNGTISKIEAFLSRKYHLPVVVQ